MIVDQTRRVLVCGGWDFTDKLLLNKILDTLHNVKLFSVVIEGGARGADEFAWLWARRNKVENITFYADWEHEGKSAGSIRNQKMLYEGKPDLVVAFPGGKGTANMVSLAKKAGISVVKVSYD